MNKALSFTLQTRTPLWTGGVAKGEMERLHEAGVLGSLRWWYEAIVRGLGGKACDPTLDGNRCPGSNDYLCDVCQLFGATGRSRRFRFRIQDGTRIFNGGNIPLPSGHPPYKGRLGGWYLPAQAQTGNELELTITPMSNDSRVNLLAVPLALIHQHAALGAKVSNGQGVLKITPKDDSTVILNKALLDQLPSGTGQANGLPDLRDFFFAKLTFQEPPAKPNWWHNIQGIAEARNEQLHSFNVYHRDRTTNQQLCREARTNLQALVADGILPLAPAVRNWLRFQWFPSLFRSRPLEDYLFGRTGIQGNIGSKIEVSHAYRVAERQWEFRIWGWIPCELPEEIRLNRRSFMAALKSTLSGVAMWDWVMDGPSPVCTLADSDWFALDCDDNNGRRYLEKLLGITKGGAQ